MQRGDIVRVIGPASQAPFFRAITRELTRAGAHPMLRPTLPSVDEALISLGSDEQLTAITAIDMLESETPHKTLSVWADENPRHMTQVPPERQAMWSRARREISDRFFERLASGEIRWCGVMMPTQGFAQDAGMSLAASKTSCSAPATSTTPTRSRSGARSRPARPR